MTFYFFQSLFAFGVKFSKWEILVTQNKSEGSRHCSYSVYWKRSVTTSLKRFPWWKWKPNIRKLKMKENGAFEWEGKKHS